MKEISHIIRKSENATIQRVNRARNKLRNILLEAGYEKRYNKEWNRSRTSSNDF